MIKNLPLQLNEAGKIKIGIKGETITSGKGNEFRPPQKLDHFILTTTEKNDAGDYVLDTDLIDRIKKNGTGLINNDGNLVGIPIRLLYENVEQNFPTRYACYAGRKLSCYGDGEKAFRRIDDYKKGYPCPCNRLDPDYDGDQKCKANGRLICMIDEAGLFGQVHIFRTTSINSVKGIWGGMELIKVATKGRLAGVSLMLTLNAKHTDHGIAYVVSVCFNGTMEALRDSVHALAAKERVYLLDVPGTGSVVEPGTEDEHDFVDEFYPDAVTNAVSKEDLPMEHEYAQNTHSQELAENESNSVDDGAENKGQEDETQKQTEKIVFKEKKEENSKPANTTPVNIDFRLLPESCNYNSLYNRFLLALNQGDFEDALKLVARIDKDRLEIFFTRERPDVIFNDPKPKKTDYLDKLAAMIDGPGPVLLKREPGDQNKSKKVPEEHPFLTEIRAMEDREQIKNAMVEFFKPMPVNLTLDRYGLIAWAEKKIGVGDGDDMTCDGQGVKPVETGSHVNDELPNNPTAPGTTTEDSQASTQTFEAESQETAQGTGGNHSPNSGPELFPYNPVSGPITDDQLRTIVELKNKLEKKGLLQKENWPGVIAEFAAVTGKPMITATSFCFDQGFELIERLNSKLPMEDWKSNIEPQDDDIPF